jgi:NADH-quinone oxidoreductase subunit L
MGLLGLPGWLTKCVLGNADLTLIFQHRWLEPVLGQYSAHLPHAYLVEFVLALMSLGVAIGGLTVAYRFYGKKAGAGDAPLEKLEPLYSRASAKFLVDELYGRLIIGPLFRGADNATRFDRRVIDGAIERVVERATAVAVWLRRLQDGRTTSYALSMVVGLNLLVVLYLIF